MLGLVEMSWVDFFGESYSRGMAIVNYICFGGLVFCATWSFIMAMMGQFRGKFKDFNTSALLFFIILLIIHFTVEETFGIPLILPPIGTPYFTDFMHVMQYFASLSIVIIGAVLFCSGALSLVGSSHQKTFWSSLAYIIVMMMVHFYLEDVFGIKLIFPPNLWS